MRFSFRCLVETVREMSTDEDETKAPDLIHVKTANRMSTGVDELQTNGSLRVETIREMSTKVDIISLILAIIALRL